MFELFAINIFILTSNQLIKLPANFTRTVIEFHPQGFDWHFHYSRTRLRWHVPQRMISRPFSLTPSSKPTSKFSREAGKLSECHTEKIVAKNYYLRYLKHSHCPLQPLPPQRTLLQFPETWVSDGQMLWSFWMSLLLLLVWQQFCFHLNCRRFF